MADPVIDVKRAPPPAPRTTGVDVLQSFRDELDRMFDQFRRGFGLPSLRGRFGPEAFWRGEAPVGFVAPTVDVAEDERAYHITADLPGMSEKDLNVTISGDVLTISAEKSEEKEAKDWSYYCCERSSGTLRRVFSLPEGIDRDKIDAKLKNGVLALTLPKTAEAQKQQKKIAVKSE